MLLSIFLIRFKLWTNFFRLSIEIIIYDFESVGWTMFIEHVKNSKLIENYVKKNVFVFLSILYLHFFKFNIKKLIEIWI